VIAARRRFLRGLGAAGVAFAAARPRLLRAQDAGAQAFQARIDEMIEAGLAFPLGRSRAEITASLGPPRAATVRKLRNQHDPAQMDELHELTYDGLRVLLYRVTAEDREFITDLSLTSAKYRVKWGLGVGNTKEAVRRVLGGGFTALAAPDSRIAPHEARRRCDERDGVCTYRYDGFEQKSHVSFSFRSGRVSRIDWTFEVD
jgi:hypothetical protein